MSYIVSMESVTIRLESELAQKVQENLKPYYSTKTEFIREAIRDKIKQLEAQFLAKELKNTSKWI